MEKYIVTVNLCSSCANKNATAPESVFRSLVQERLKTERSDYDWNVQPSPCQRVCPEARITMGVSSSKNPNDVRMTLSKDATVESVVKEVLSFFRPIQK